MSDTRLIEEVRRYPPDVVFPYPWRVEISPQVNDTTAWSVLDADGTEIITVAQEEVANALAAVPQFIARIAALEEALRAVLRWDVPDELVKIATDALAYQNTALSGRVADEASKE